MPICRVRSCFGLLKFTSEFVESADFVESSLGKVGGGGLCWGPSLWSILEAHPIRCFQGKTRSWIRNWVQFLRLVFGSDPELHETMHTSATLVDVYGIIIAILWPLAIWSHMKLQGSSMLQRNLKENMHRWRHVRLWCSCSTFLIALGLIWHRCWYDMVWRYKEPASARWVDMWESLNLSGQTLSAWAEKNLPSRISHIKPGSGTWPRVGMSIPIFCRERIAFSLIRFRMPF